MVLLACLLLSLTAFAQETFEHAINEGPKPWNNAQVDATEDKFTFALFSDLTGGERERIYEVAVAQLNLLRPDLIVNVGDLIDGIGGEDTIEWHNEWDWFDQRSDRARAPVFYTGGNHDLTGKMARFIWEERYGQRYYHFIYKEVLFLVLDSEDHTPERMEEIKEIRNEAIRRIKAEGQKAFLKTEYARLPERSFGKIGPEQSAYFTEVIEANPEVRWTFLMVHKPVWEAEEEQAFAAIESALTGMPYTVFHGHTHYYRYMERNGRDYINLATTGGRQSEGVYRSMDHVTLVTVDDDEVAIANLLMEGILDKTGKVPLGGDTLVFERRKRK